MKILFISIMGLFLFAGCVKKLIPMSENAYVVSGKVESIEVKENLVYVYVQNSNNLVFEKNKEIDMKALSEIHVDDHLYFRGLTYNQEFEIIKAGNNKKFIIKVLNDKITVFDFEDNINGAHKKEHHTSETNSIEKWR